jgi:hypothetical protein
LSQCRFLSEPCSRPMNRFVRASALDCGGEPHRSHRFRFGASQTRHSPPSRWPKLKSGDSADFVAALQNLAACRTA